MEEYIMFVNVKVQYYIIKNIYKLIYDRFDVISVKTRASLVHFLETGQSNWLKDSCRNASEGKTLVPVGTGACSPAVALNKQKNTPTNRDDAEMQMAERHLSRGLPELATQQQKKVSWSKELTNQATE